MVRAREAMLPAAAPRMSTSSPASCWRSSASFPGAQYPVMPVEIMLLPKWFPFHHDKVSYWAER